MSQPSLDLGLDDAPEPTFSVGELAAALGQAVRRSFPDDVWVRGEIDSLNRSAAGHLYFDLCERIEGRRFVVHVTCWNRARQAVEHLLARHRMRLENGMEIRMCGRLELYEERGQINLRMTGIDPTYTLGRLAQDRDRIVRLLEDEGLLARNKRLALPAVPLRVGLVASTKTAGYADFTDELRRSGLAWKLTVADARVQGADAPESIVAALRRLARRPLDVVALVRGGGSRTDLAVFDSEAVARAIAAMPHPVFTGVGHEVDRSVADLVAHTDLKTPTACAGLLVERVRGFLSALDDLAHRVRHAGTGSLEAAAQRAAHATALVRRDVRRALEQAETRTDRAVARLDHATSVRLQREHHQLEEAGRRLARAAPGVLAGRDREIDGIAARVRLLDPALTLARGWTITRRADGSLVRRAGELQPGDHIVTTFADGDAPSRVEGESR